MAFCLGRTCLPAKESPKKDEFGKCFKQPRGDFGLTLLLQSHCPAASRRASVQAVTSKGHFRTTSPINTASSAGEN